MLNDLRKIEIKNAYGEVQVEFFLLISHDCFHFLSPVPNITWSRGGWYVSRAIRQKWGQELVFQNLRTYDEGSYTCVGSNLVTGEEASYEIQLKVEGRNLSVYRKKKFYPLYAEWAIPL